MTEEPASPPRQRAVSRLRFLGAIVATSVAAVAFALEISPLISVASEAPVGLSTSFEARFEVG